VRDEDKKALGIAHDEISPALGIYLEEGSGSYEWQGVDEGCQGAGTPARDKVVIVTIVPPRMKA
jgi:hypothetical protein